MARPRRIAGIESAARHDPVPWLDLGLVMTGALGLTLVIALGDSIPALQAPRLLLGLVYALYVPGYTLVAALFPRPDDLDGPERLAASFALSFAVIPAIALLLDKLPWGIRPWPILVSLDLFVAIGSVVTWRRRRQLPGMDLGAPATPPGWRERWTGPGRKSLAIRGALAVALVLTLASLALVVLAPDQGERLTEFYLLGPDGLAQDYPRTATVGQTVSLTLGIVNWEGAPTTYRVEVLTNGQPSGRAGPVQVAPGAQRELPVSFAPRQAGNDVEVTFWLYRGSDKTPYRTLRLWLSVKEPRDENVGRAGGCPTACGDGS